MLNIICQAGLGADCVSGGEIEAASKAGFPANKIVYAGVGKSDWEIRLGLEKGIFCFNVESLAELEIIQQLAAEMNKKANICLRINPNVGAHTHANITTGLAENKFGIALGDMMDVIEKAHLMSHIHIMGLHFHIGSQILDMGDFEALCNRINDIQKQMEQHLDVDLFLRAYAVNVMVGMWDDYWINQNNYFFYFDSNHRFYFIPFDYDNTLGTSGAGINPGTQDMLHWGSLGGDRMLMCKVMSIPAFQERYKGYIRELASSDELFGTAGSQARIRQWQTMIRPYVDNDTGEDTRTEDKPASWGNHPQYRLLSGGIGDGQSSETNYFDTKINSIYWE